MRPAGYISVREYASRCGISVPAVHHRINRGHLDGAVQRSGSRIWIQPDRADDLFAQRGRPCNSRAMQIENRLMAAVDQIAAELACQPRDYCSVALWRWAGQILAD